ncbi:MAG TPA: hypothetical protein PLL69_04710 [Gemmatimonadales bacterium]|nr:hypothetical protein [Gemmatimonadales bacterium]
MTSRVQPGWWSRSLGGAAWSTADAAQSLREAARALAALHRRGLHHGALVADAMLLKGDHMVIHHLGRSTVGSVADDLYRLGAIISSSLPRHREGALPALHVLLGRMTDPDRGRRPDSAEEVLAALDPLPGRGNDRGLLIAGAPHDSRAVVAPRHLLIVVAVLVTMLLAWWLMRAMP